MITLLFGTSHFVSHMAETGENFSKIELAKLCPFCKNHQNNQEPNKHFIVLKIVWIDLKILKMYTNIKIYE